MDVLVARNRGSISRIFPLSAKVSEVESAQNGSLDIAREFLPSLSASVEPSTAIDDIVDWITAYGSNDVSEALSAFSEGPWENMSEAFQNDWRVEGNWADWWEEAGRKVRNFYREEMSSLEFLEFSAFIARNR